MLLVRKRTAVPTGMEEREGWSKQNAFLSYWILPSKSTSNTFVAQFLVSKFATFTFPHTSVTFTSCGLIIQNKEVVFVKITQRSLGELENNTPYSEGSFSISQNQLANFSLSER